MRWYWTSRRCLEACGHGADWNLADLWLTMSVFLIFLRFLGCKDNEMFLYLCHIQVYIGVNSRFCLFLVRLSASLYFPSLHLNVSPLVATWLSLLFSSLAARLSAAPSAEGMICERNEKLLADRFSRERQIDFTAEDKTPTILQYKEKCFPSVSS